MARTLSGALWQLLLFLIGGATLALGVLIPFELLLRADNVSYLSYILRSLSDLFTPLFPLLLLLAPIALLTLVDTAMTAGTLLFARKRALGLILSLTLATLVAIGLFLGASLLGETFLPDALRHFPSLLVSCALITLGLLAIRKLLGRYISST